MACHVNPDADALGSMLGLSAYLRARGIETICSFPNEPLEPPRWASLLPGVDRLVEASEFPREPEVMVTCDCASADRLGRLQASADRATELIWIDHHRSNDGLGTIPLIDPDASSTCEMVVRLITVMGGDMPDETALCLYAGLVTDTGKFQYEATRPETLRIAADLREHDFDHTGLVQALYEDNRREYLSLVGTALGRMAYEPEADLIWTYLTQSDLTGRRRARAGDRRPDRRDPHGARGGRRRRAEADEGRPIQGERPLARQARPRGRRRDLRRGRAPARGRLHLGSRPRRDDRAAGGGAARRARRPVSAGGPEGLLLVDKPGGITSHDAVDRVRRALGTRKVGHAGTLDPMATGLLVIGVGRATRLLRFLGDLDKTYEGAARLGVETDTLDADGEVVRTREVPASLDAGRDPAPRWPASRASRCSARRRTRR